MIEINLMINMRKIGTLYCLACLTIIAWRLVDVGGTAKKPKLGDNYQYYSSVSSSNNHKVDLPPKYDVVYPYAADKTGRYVGQLKHCTQKDNIPRTRSKYVKNLRSNSSSSTKPKKLYIAIKLPEEKLILTLRSNKKLTSTRPQVEFFDDSGKIKRSYINDTCHYVGRVINKKHSTVSLSNCNGRLSGLIRTFKTDYFIEPLNEVYTTQRIPHIIYGVETAMTWKNVTTCASGDIMHSKLHHRNKMKRDSWLFDDDYQIFINTSIKLYLETLIIVDNTVVKFHNSERSTAEYILTIMNIVSTIYEDPALDGNMQIIVSKILVANESKHNVSIVKGDNKVSLENVCKFSSKIKSEDNVNYDITIYLTRDDIGGVSGFAPLLSICDTENSCTVIKDEGLTSAFILAHEIAHVLGLSHDGDKVKGNNCLLENNQHSIMAPTVQSNFNRMWFCMLNKPKKNSPQSTLRNSLPGSVYSLDEQCRQEFGSGHNHCKLYKSVDPCQILWCSSQHKKFVCTTKQKPPLDGTKCGESKWCMNGHCVKANKRKLPRNPIYRNPRHGGWSEWSPFGPCSRSCGIGVTFRARKCNKPEPTNGGNYCKGENEEFQLCNTQKCPENKDFRSEQCRTFGKHHSYLSKQGLKHNWVPAPTNISSNECKLHCISKQNNQNYAGENVIDGTPCSYDGSLNVCVQGSCQRVGCEGVLNSTLQINSCGVCDKNNSYCQVTEKLFSKILTKRFTQVGVIPKRARNLMIRKTTGSPNYIVLRSRRYRQFVLNGGKEQEGSKLFVAMGTLFNYKVDNETETITAQGPLLEELVVLVSVKRRKTLVKVFSNYTLPMNKSFDSIINFEEYYHWRVVGWSECSRLCGEGIQKLKIQCIDKRNKHSVRKRHCSLLDKPIIRKRKCNVFPCHYRWKVYEWEYCSQTCGSKGVQSREIKCVLKTNYSEIVRKPHVCSAIEKPALKQSCNVKPCPSNWEIGPWSQCSASCGNGTIHRNVTCIPPINEVHNECTDPPINVDICEGPPCPKPCLADSGDYCKEDIYHTFCIVESFYQQCCKSCDKYLNEKD